MKKIGLLLSIIMLCSMLMFTSADNMHFSGNKYLVGDVNGDGIVDMKDIGQIIAQYGRTRWNDYGFPSTKYNPDNDLNEDRVISMTDIGLANQHFGQMSVWSLKNYDWEVINATQYWGESWTYPYGNTWTFDNKGHCLMHGTAYLFEWNNIGLYQGTKPFGWGQAPVTWTPFTIREDVDNCELYWASTIHNATANPAGPVNVGVDLWFEVEHPIKGNIICEFYSFIYSVDIAGFRVPVGSTGWMRRTWQNYSWDYVKYVEYQAEFGEYCERTAYLFQYVQIFKNYMHSLHPEDRWLEAVFKLKTMDLTMEGSNYSGWWTVDYCYLYKT